MAADPAVVLLETLIAKYGPQAVSFGIGIALGTAAEPYTRSILNDLWRTDQSLPIAAGTAADLAAQSVLSRDAGAREAEQHGVNGDRFDSLIAGSLTVPGVGELLAAIRRGKVSEDDFTHGLRKHKLDERYDEALRNLASARLEPAEIAKAIHRGIMRGDGLLIAEPPAAAGRVPAVPPSDLDPVAEAAAWGFDHERLRILTGNAGLPPGLIEMLHLLNMGKVTVDDVQRAVAESNLRNEYQDVVINLRRRLLTPHDYVEAHVRAWIDEEAMRAGAELSGMEPADTDLLFKVTGRPLSWHQVFIGERRGGTYDGGNAGIDPAFLKALEESNIRPEWYQLAWAQRYSYPSAFVLRQLTASGELTAAEAEKILLYEGWEPELAAKVSHRWAAGGAGGGKEETKAELADEYEGGFVTEAEYRDALGNLGYTGHAQDLLVHLGDARRMKRYREKVVDAIAAGYLAFKIADAAALSELAEVNVTGEAAQLLVALWGKQRRDTIRLLTPAQLKKAFKEGLIDRATVLSELEDREYTLADAATLLDE